MANVVDFSPLEQKVTPWGSVLDPITEEMKRRNAQAYEMAKQEAGLAPAREAQKRLEAKDAETARHNKAREDKDALKQWDQDNVKEWDRRAGTEQKIRDAIARGDLDTAEQLGTGYTGLNIEGKGGVQKGLPGFKMDRGIKPSEPAPTEDVIGDAVGYAGDVSTFNQKQSHPDIMIAGVHTTPDALRYSASRAAAADMGKVEDALRAQLATATTMHDTATAAAIQGQLRDIQVRRSQVEGGLVKPDQAIKANDTVTGAATKQQGALDLQDKKGGTAVQVAGINAKRRIDAASAGQAGRDASKAAERGSGTSEKAYARVQSDLSTFDKQHNISTDRNEEERARTLLGNQDKNIVQRAMATYLSRGLAGEKGALSNQDIQRIQGDLGGAWADVMNWVSRKGEGSLDPAILDQLTAGVKVVLAEKETKRAQAEKLYEARFLRPTYVGQKWGFSDDLLNAFEEKFGHPYQPTQASAAPGGREPSSGDDAPNGPHANDPLEGDGPPPTGPRKFSRDDLLRMAKERGLKVP